MNTKYMMKKSGRFLKKYLPEILTIASTIGVGASIYLTRKATKAEQILQNEGNLEAMEPIEKVKAYASIYWPVAIVSSASIGCMWCAHILDKRTQSQLLSAYMALGQAYERYKEVVRNNVDQETYCKIQEEYEAEMKADRELPRDTDEQLLFYLPFYNKYFNRTMREVIDAEYQVNREFALAGYASFNTFLDALGIYPIVGGDDIGWSQDAGVAFYGYGWIEFEHRLQKTDDGLECYYIDMPFLPTEDYQDYGIGQIIS